MSRDPSARETFSRCWSPSEKPEDSVESVVSCYEELTVFWGEGTAIKSDPNVPYAPARSTRTRNQWFPGWFFYRFEKCVPLYDLVALCPNSPINCFLMYARCLVQCRKRISSYAYFQARKEAKDSCRVDPASPTLSWKHSRLNLAHSHLPPIMRRFRNGGPRNFGNFGRESCILQVSMSHFEPHFETGIPVKRHENFHRDCRDCFRQWKWF